jgi:hypothetical protein
LHRTALAPGRTCIGPRLHRAALAPGRTCTGPRLHRAALAPGRTCTGPRLHRAAAALASGRACTGPHLHRAAAVSCASARPHSEAPPAVRRAGRGRAGRPIPGPQAGREGGRRRPSRRQARLRLSGRGLPVLAGPARRGRGEVGASLQVAPERSAAGPVARVWHTARPVRVLVRQKAPSPGQLRLGVRPGRCHGRSGTRINAVTGLHGGFSRGRRPDSGMRRSLQQARIAPAGSVA